MHLIAYVSDYIHTTANIDDVLNNIVIAARRDNADMSITGVLFYMNGRFVQILEGDKDNLNDLVQIIKDDPRHKNFKILIDRPVLKRGFNDWHMEVMHLRAGKTFSRDYIETIMHAFENMMILQSDTLAEFYKSLMEERIEKPSLIDRLKNLLCLRRKIMIV